MKKPGAVLILKHVPNEDAGTIIPFLDKEGISSRAINLYANESLPPAAEGLHAVVVMGGPMNVDEEDKFLFLKSEISFLKEAIRQKVPCLGICLGAQLLAKALGARVYKAPAPEIGWDEVSLTDQARGDRVFSAVAPQRLKVLQWHEDTFELPKNAVLLASSKTVPHQAFRYGENVYGLQFHVEVEEGMLRDWFKSSPKLSDILAQYAAYRQKLSEITEQLYRKFFKV